MGSLNCGLCCPLVPSPGFFWNCQPKLWAQFVCALQEVSSPRAGDAAAVPLVPVSASPASFPGNLSSHSASPSSSSFCSDVRSLMYFPEHGRGKGGRGERGGPDTRVSKDCGAGSRQPAAWSHRAFRQSIPLRLRERAHPPAAGWTTAVQPWEIQAGMNQQPSHTSS